MMNPALEAVEAAIPAAVIDEYVAERVIREDLMRRAELAGQLGYGFDADALLPNAMRAYHMARPGMAPLAAFSEGVGVAMGIRGKGPHPWTAEFIVFASDDLELSRTIDRLADQLKAAFCYPGSGANRFHYQLMTKELYRLGEELREDPAAFPNRWRLSRKAPFTVTFEISYARSIEALRVDGPDEGWEETDGSELLPPPGLRPGSVWETVGGVLRPASPHARCERVIRRTQVRGIGGTKRSV